MAVRCVRCGDPDIKTDHTCPSAWVNTAAQHSRNETYYRERCKIAEKAVEQARALLEQLIKSLPKCDLCSKPATRSPARGRERRCDEHPYVSRVPGEQFVAPDYPRAEPLRAALTWLEKP